MASTPYKGGAGAGGKFRKLPFGRKASRTPYDRPPTALRAAQSANQVESGNGWLSKLVEPASRLVAKSASRLFSSVFQKRLTAPPGVPAYNQQDQDVPEAPQLVEKPTDKVRDLPNDEENTISNHDGNKLGVDYHSCGTSGLEELLKEKTFTRSEFEQLTELLKSRVVESSQSKPSSNLQQIRNFKVSELTNKKQQLVLQSKRVHLPNEDDVEGAILEHQTKEPLKLHGHLTRTVENVIDENYASPAEIAKAYMGSKSSKAFPETVGIRNLAIQENKQLSNEFSYGKPPSDLPLVTSPAVTFTGTPKVYDSGYKTPRIHGRSAMHRMSRSPFFKFQTESHSRGGRATESGPRLTYELTSTKMIQTQGKKRHISDLDDDVASSGHIRRIRQKYQVTTPLNRLSSGHTLQSWNQQARNVVSTAGSGLSNQKPLYLEEREYTGGELNAVEGNFASPVGVVPIPPQSSEMARKIFQQLDKLMPSPKEKSSEHKNADRNELQFKLSNNMLHGRALKSMQKIDSPNFLEVQEVGNLGAVCGAVQENLPGLITETKDKGEENGLLEPHVVVLKVASEAVDKDKSAIIVSDDKSSVKTAEFSASGATDFVMSDKPAFRLSAPEDFFDFDDENNESEKPSLLDVRRDNKVESIPESQPVNGEMTGHEKHVEPLSKLMPLHSTGFERDSDKKASDRPVAKNNNEFTLPTVPVSISSSAMFSPPASSVSSGNSDLPKERVADDTSNGTVTILRNSPTKFSERLNFSSNATLQEDKVLEKRNKYINGENLFTTFGNASPSLPASTSPAVSISGDSATLGLNFNVPQVNSNTSSVSSTAANNSSVNSVANSSVTTSSLFGPSISATAPVFSTNSSFQFGSSNSLEASKPLGLITGKSDVITQGTGSSASPSFGINDVAPVTSKPSFSSTSNNSALSSVVSTMSNSTSASSTSLFTSISNGAAAPPTSAVSNSANNFFAFGAPSSSAGLTITSSSNGPQNLGTLFQSNNKAVNLPETQPSNGVLLPSPASSQFSSFTSTAALGMASSSSSSSTSSVSPSSLAFGADPKPIGSGTGLLFSMTAGSSSSSVSNTSFAPATTFSSPAGFSFSSGAFSSSVSGSASSLVSGNPFSSSSGFSFSAAVSSSTSSTSTSFVPSPSTSLFTSSTSTSPSLIFGSTSSSAASSTGFSFGSSPSGSSAFTFGASSGSTFSFNSAGNTNSSISPAQPIFGVPNQFTSASGSPGNDQMNMEDSMADDPVQPPIQTVSAFGQPTNVPATPNFVFGTPPAPNSTSTFQFGNQQNFAMPQSPSPFQNSGNLEFGGGSFSLGSADKSGRRIVRAKRDKHRKK